MQVPENPNHEKTVEELKRHVINAIVMIAETTLDSSPQEILSNAEKKPSNSNIQNKASQIKTLLDGYSTVDIDKQQILDEANDAYLGAQMRNP